MSAALIADALFAHAAELETNLSMPIAWPEVEFEPPADGKYLSVQFFTNRLAWEGVSDGRQDQGLLQVDVVWPKNGGLIAPNQLAAQVEAHFPKGLRLSSGSARVKISREPWTASPLVEDDLVRIPVTISWTA